MFGGSSPALSHACLGRFRDKNLVANRFAVFRPSCLGRATEPMVQSKKHTLGAILTILPLICRASIYLLLSTIAVISINLIEVNQDKAYKIYLPLFIAIYVLSR